MDNKELEKLKKILESCHINFLIGSGASMDYLGTLKNVEDLLTNIQENINSAPSNEEFKIVEASIKYQYFKNSIRGNLGFNDKNIALEKKDDFKKTRENYNQFILALNTILIRRKSSILDKQINLFTSNMDLFLDCALESNNIEFNDGFSGRQNPIFSTSNFKKSIYQTSPHYDNKSELAVFNLFKMHGAVNWKKVSKGKNEVIIYDPFLTALGKLDKIAIKEADLIEITNNDNLEELIKKAKDKKLNDSINNFLKIYAELVIVNPTKGKFALTTIDYNFYEQLRMYSNALEKENSVLFVTGFSFADEHIREITQRVVKSNPTLIVYVFCFSESDKKQIEELFPSGKYKNVVTINQNKKYCFQSQINDFLHPLANEFDSEYFVSKKTEKINVIINNQQEPNTKKDA